MPLIIMCGHPMSGKTTRAKQIAKHLTDQGATVKLINLEALDLDRNVVQKDSMSEKKGRGALLSAVEKEISKSTVVILDFLNTIKGYRYELYCRAKTASTQHCVVFCDVTPEVAKQTNEKLAENVRYEEKIIDDLLKRLEVPDSKNRWDSPLFTVKDEKEELPLKEITDAVLHGKAHTASFATASKKEEAPSFVYDLDRVTQDIVKAVLAAQSTGLFGAGDAVKVPHTTATVTLSRKLGLPELRRLQQQFIKIAQLRPLAKVEEIASSFVDHLTTNA